MTPNVIYIFSNIFMMINFSLCTTTSSYSCKTVQSFISSLLISRLMHQLHICGLQIILFLWAFNVLQIRALWKEIRFSLEIFLKNLENYSKNLWDTCTYSKTYSTIHIHLGGASWDNVMVVSEMPPSLLHRDKANHLSSMRCICGLILLEKIRKGPSP